MEPTFESILSFPPETLCALLRDAYAFEPGFERDFLSQREDFDRFFHDHPAIAESCGFMTALGRTPIGFVTWNPTHLPEYVEMGHNCIASAFKGRGFGRMQMRHAVRRILDRGPQSIRVTTNEILVPAQHTMKARAFASSAGAKSRSALGMPDCAWNIG